MPSRWKSNFKEEGLQGMFPNLIPTLILLGKGMRRVILREKIRVLMMLQKERQNRFLKKNLKLKSLKGEIETLSAGSVKV